MRDCRFLFGNYFQVVSRRTTKRHGNAGSWHMIVLIEKKDHQMDAEIQPKTKFCM